jgi:protein-tyrosine kinase
LDPIRQAIDIARRSGEQSPDTQLGENSLDAYSPFPPSGEADAQFREFKLSGRHLEESRIVAYDPLHEHGRYYDMLRTQVLQAMDHDGWQILAITSPTAGCGKSVTACNLAMSIARLPERSVLLVDMDLQKPKVAEYLGIDFKEGLLSVLEGRTTLLSRIVQVSIGRNQMLVLPSEVCRSGSAEWMASQTMTTLLQTIKRDFRSHIIVLDMPPILVGDDVISVLPQVESILLVAGVGATTVSDIKETNKHLKSTPVVRVVVNKAAEKTEAYYGYFEPKKPRSFFERFRR